MATFYYEAMNNAGRRSTGRLSAESSGEAIAELRARGLFPTKIRGEQRCPNPQCDAMNEPQGTFCSQCGMRLQRPKTLLTIVFLVAIASIVMILAIMLA